MESEYNIKPNSFYFDLFEENQNIIIIVDSNTGRIFHANKSACLFFGYQYEQLISLTITDLNSLAIEDLNNKIYATDIDTKKPLYLPHRLSNNEIKQVRVYLSPITLDNKEYLYYFAFDNEISDNLLSPLVFASSPYAKIMIDSIGNAIAVNDSFSDLFGYTNADFSKEDNDYHNFTRDKTTIDLDKVLQGEIEMLNSVRFTMDSQAIPVNIIGIPYIQNDEIIGAMIVYANDSQSDDQLSAASDAYIDDIIATKNRLQLILDSTVEAIFGVDENGICNFCNNSVLKMLGYQKKEDLLGKRIHDLIHHSYIDGRPMPYDECKITQSIKNQNSIHVEDEVFWRTDGSYFYVSYYSHPQEKDGKIIGTVVTFTDITERKCQEEHIKYVSNHDSLTNLYNRFFFSEEMKRLDTKDNLPISIIYADIDGLKLTNDIFGHQEGDSLLIKSAQIFKSVTKNGIIARVGGDEFTILLPKTSKTEATKILKQIREEFQKEEYELFYNSISLGVETKVTSDEVIEKTMKIAETMMYNDKISNRKFVNKRMIEEIIDKLHQRSPKEQYHSEHVSKLATAIARKMGMTENDIRKTKDAAYLHDIGKIVLDDNLLKNQGVKSKEDKELLQQHTVIGFRILDLFDETLDLAEIVLNHHEYYNGTGYPKGLVGDDIPLIARIIAVAEAYDSHTNIHNPNVLDKEAAIREIDKESGGKYDPRIVKMLKLVLEEID